MKMLMPTAVLLAAFFQAPANPPMKMGLWESRATDKIRQPDGTDKIANRVVRNCVTRQNWLTLMGPTAIGACPKTNEAWTKDSYSFDVTCPDKPRLATVTIHFETPETQRGTLDMYSSPDGAPLSVHSEFEEHWIGADCEDVSPDHPVIVR